MSGLIGSRINCVFRWGQTCEDTVVRIAAGGAPTLSDRARARSRFDPYLAWLASAHVFYS